VSDEAIEDCHMKAGKDMLCMYINNNEDTEMFKGKGLRLGGSRAVYEDNETYFGDLSAIIIENLPFWADFSTAPSLKTSLMDEWEAKMDAIIEETINEDITSLAGVPSWMLVLLNRILEVTGKKSGISALITNRSDKLFTGIEKLPSLFVSVSALEIGSCKLLFISSTQTFASIPEVLPARETEPRKTGEFIVFDDLPKLGSINSALSTRRTNSAR
jgi:hypothetical protein